MKQFTDLLMVDHSYCVHRKRLVVAEVNVFSIRGVSCVQFIVNFFFYMEVKLQFTHTVSNNCDWRLFPLVLVEMGSSSLIANSAL
jgi:hypothetical protein